MTWPSTVSATATASSMISSRYAGAIVLSEIVDALPDLVARCVPGDIVVGHRDEREEPLTGCSACS
jgi:hypothetical protein